MTGRVRHFNSEKNFGFIQIHPDVAEFFFHSDQVIGEIPRSGQEVSFWLDDDPRKEGMLRAVEVQIAVETDSRLTGPVYG